MNVIGSLWKAGAAYAAAGDEKKSRSAFEESLVISRKLNRKHPQTPQFARAVDHSASLLEEQGGRN